MCECPSCIEKLHLKTNFEKWETQAYPVTQIEVKDLTVWKFGDLNGEDRELDIYLNSFPICASNFFSDLVSEYIKSFMSWIVRDIHHYFLKGNWQVQLVYQWYFFFFSFNF